MGDSNAAPGALTERRGNTLIVTINRPEAKNAMTRAAAEGIAAAIGKLSDYCTLEAQRIEQLQGRQLPDRTAESIVLRAWEQGLVGTRLLRPLLDEWRKPTFEEFEDRTAWSMLAAFTHVVKERQRRYPSKAAWEVMQFQAILAA